MAAAAAITTGSPAVEAVERDAADLPKLRLWREIRRLQAFVGADPPSVSSSTMLEEEEAERERHPGRDELAEALFVQ